MAKALSDRELLGQFVASAESEGDEQELQQLLLEHSGRLAMLLGKDVRSLETVCRLPHGPRIARVRALVKLAVQARETSRADQRRNLSGAAATMLSHLARWHDDRVEVSAAIVLGNLLSDVKHAVCFDVEGQAPVIVMRRKLREASKVLRFSDLRCYIDAAGLHFRWHGGRGGLNLVSQELDRRCSESVIPVPLSRPLPKPEIRSERAEPIRRGVWIGDALTELGFF